MESEGLAMSKFEEWAKIKKAFWNRPDIRTACSNGASDELIDILCVELDELRDEFMAKHGSLEPAQ